MERATTQDLVCGMRLSTSDAPASVQWAGRRYHFCSDLCRRSFETDPARYLERRGESAPERVVRIPLVGVACAAGDRLPLERGLLSVTGVIDAYVNPVDEAAYLTVDAGLFRVAEAVAVLERFGARAVVAAEAPGKQRAR